MRCDGGRCITYKRHRGLPSVHRALEIAGSGPPTWGHDLSQPPAGAGYPCRILRVHSIKILLLSLRLEQTREEVSGYDLRKCFRIAVFVENLLWAPDLFDRRRGRHQLSILSFANQRFGRTRLSRHDVCWFVLCSASGNHREPLESGLILCIL